MNRACDCLPPVTAAGALSSWPEPGLVPAKPSDWPWTARAAPPGPASCSARGPVGPPVADTALAGAASPTESPCVVSVKHPAPSSFRSSSVIAYRSSCLCLYCSRCYCYCCRSRGRPGPSRSATRAPSCCEA